MGGSTRSSRGSAPGRSTRAPGAWTRFSAALAAAIVAIVGIPTLLIVCATAVLDRRHPIPAIGSGEAIGEYFERGLTVTEIVPIAVRVLLVVAWLLWLAMALSIVGSVVEAATGNRRRWPHFRLFAGLARWIAAGLTAVSSLSANFVSAGAMPSPLPFTISAVQTIDAASAVPVERAVPTGHARVLPGESAETFALRTLGDAGRWIDIWQLNQNRPVGPGGEIWTAAWKLSAGWDLRLPAGTAGPAGAAAPAERVDGDAGVPVAPVPDGTGMATPADAAPPADADVVPSAGAEPAGSLDEVEQYRVQPGDSYWAIAEGRLGPGASGSAVAAYTEALMMRNAPRLGHPTPVMLRPGDLVSLVTPPTEVAVGVSTSDDEMVDDSGEPSATGAHVHVVETGDSYWRIAEQRAVQLHGNDGAHGTVVYGLMLDLIDLNAPRLGYDDREMLHPGDEVWLFDPELSTPSPSELAVPVAEAASAIVDTATAAADVAVGAVAENAEEVAATGSSDHPVPNPPESAPPTTVEAPTSTDVPLGPAGGDASGDVAESPRRSSPSPIGLGEAALIATGIVALIAARRRARLRSAEPPARVPLPGASAAAAERELRRVSSADRLLRLDIAVRAAAATMADTASQIAAVCSSSDGSIELVTTTAVTLPDPWSGDGTRWTLAADVEVDDLAVASRTVGVPCVALTEIGVDDEGRDVLVDLEAFGVIAIDADPESADDIVRAIATGLASSEFAEVAHLVGVGVDAAAFLDHRHAHSAGTVDESVELAATLVGPTASAQRSTFALRSRHTGGETWEPAVILVATSAAAELTPHVLRDVMSRRGVALVVGGPVVGAASTLRPAGDTWLLDPLGIRVRPVGLDRASLDDLADAVAVPAAVKVDFAPPPVASAGSVDADEAMAVAPGRVIHDLLDAGTPDPAAHVVVVDVAAGASDLAMAPITIAETADDRGSAVPGLNGVTLDVSSNGNGHGPGVAEDGAGRNGNGRGPGIAESGAGLNGASPPSPPSPAPSGSGQASQPAASLVVRLLGPVDLVDGAGRAARFERSKTLELLAWIVTHRDRATRSGARTALWDLDVRDATFANVVSEARRVMGRHVDPPEGDEWLRRTMTDELSLHDGVVADVDTVRAALAAARGVDGSGGLALLRPAVELVRGMPFAGTSYLWPDVEGLTSNLVLLTTSVTAEYARLALDAGDVDGVFWATGQGLNVLPGQESLIGIRMRAHAERGDLSGVRVEWEAYERVLNADPWSDGEPAEKLVLLRKQLLSK